MRDLPEIRINSGVSIHLSPEGVDFERCPPLLVHDLEGAVSLLAHVFEA